MKKIVLGKETEFFCYLNETFPLEIVLDFSSFSPTQMQNNFFNIIGEENMLELLNSRYMNGDTGEVILGKSFVNGFEITTENSFSFYKSLKIRTTINGIVVGETFKKVQEFLFQSEGNHAVEFDILDLKGNFIKKFPIQFRCKKLIKDIKILNLENKRVLVFPDFDLYLKVGRTPYILEVEKIVNKSPQDVYEVYVEKDTGGFAVLGVGTELNFGIFGTKSIEENKEFVFMINKILSENKSEEAIGIIRIKPIAENLFISDKKYYDLKGIQANSGNSVKIENFTKDKNLITKKFSKKPLFFYFVCKGEIKGDIEVINGSGEIQDIVVDIKDSTTRFVYFNKLDGQNYFYKKNSFLIPVKEKEILDAYFEYFKIEKNFLNMKVPKRLEYITVKANRPMEKISIEYQNEQNKIVVLKGITNILTSEEVTGKYERALEAKHIAINDTVKYLRITEEVEKLIDGKLVTVDSDLEDDFEIGNYFVDFSFSENTITMLKNSNDFIYYAKKASEKNKEKILSKVLKLDKKYAMENNELVEYPDGYIELKPFFMDHIFQDLDEIKKEVSFAKVFSLNIKPNNEFERNLALLYAKNFKTVGMPLRITEVE